jgi:hypothetical protein
MVLKEGFFQAGMHPENQDLTKQRAIKEAMALLVAAEVTDPGQKTEDPLAAEQPSLNLLGQAVKEFKEKPHTPEMVTSYWQTLWKVWGEKAGLSLTIPSCDRTRKEITRLEKEGRKLVYVPTEVASQENRHLLGRIFPEMQSYSVKKDNPVTNESNQGGWFDIEANLDSPNRNTKENDLKNLFEKQGKSGQRLNTFIIASQDAKLQTGHYFDENTWSRLVGSRSAGRVVDASFGVLGRLRVHWSLGPQDHFSSWGGRSEGVKKA